MLAAKLAFDDPSVRARYPRPHVPAGRPFDRYIRSSNTLLALLPDGDMARLRPHLERVQLKRRQVLQERNLPVQHAYFIERGAVSLLCREGQGTAMEVATLGSTDFTGLPVVLGSGRSPHRCVVQVPGEAVRIAAPALAQALEELPCLRRVLLLHVQLLLTQTAQIAVCNTRHTLSERVARSLLTMRDCLGRDIVPLTHECLARGLGVRRASVTTTIGELERSGLVRRGRGEIGIADPEGLEARSCSCHRAVAAERQRLVAEPGDTLSPAAGSLRPALRCIGSDSPLA